MRRATLEMIVALGLMCLCIAGTVEAARFPQESAYLPTAVFAAASLLSLVWAGQSFATRLRRGGGFLILEPLELRRLALIAAGALALAVAIPTLGFFTSFAFLVPGIAWATGYRRPRGLAVGTLIFIGVLYAVFVLILNRPLPVEVWQALLA